MAGWIVVYIQNIFRNKLENSYSLLLVPRYHCHCCRCDGRASERILSLLVLLCSSKPLPSLFLQSLRLLLLLLPAISTMVDCCCCCCCSPFQANSGRVVRAIFRLPCMPYAILFILCSCIHMVCCLSVLKRKR